MSNIKSLSLFEKATIKITLRRLNSKDMLQVLKQAEPGWSDSTYYRRLADARASLEKKGLLIKVITHGVQDWLVAKEIIQYMPNDQLVEELYYLHNKIIELEYMDANSQSEIYNLKELSTKLENEKFKIQEELNVVKNDSRNLLEERLVAKFPELHLNSTWIEALVLLALIEIMARQKLASFQKEKIEEKKFSELLDSLQKLLPKLEGRDFDFNKDLVKGLYAFRNKIIHNGLSTSVRPKEVEGISALVEDIYLQLFEN